MVKAKYVLSNFFKLFIISCLCLLAIFFVIQILEDLPDIISGEKILNLVPYFLSLPYSFVQISPLITLLSGMFFVSEMVKGNEIKIFEISGINSFRIFSILLFSSLIICLFTFFIKNYTVPQTFFFKENIYQKPISFSCSSLLFKSDTYDENEKFINPEISIISKDGSICLIKAKECINENKNLWTFIEGKINIIDKNGNLEKSESFSSKTVKLPISAEVILNTMKNPDSLKLNQLQNIIKEMKKNEISPYLFETYFYEKLGYPLLNFFILFAIFPFFFLKGKISKFFVLSATIVIGFLTYGIYTFFISLSKGGKVPPFIGGWIFHIIMFFSFLLLLYKSKIIEKKKNI